MKFFLVRHVETYGNVEGRLNGHTESEYTERGKKMKEILVETLVALDKKVAFDKIYTSPTQRAYKIAEAVSKETKKEVITDLRLREFNFGIFEGKTQKECYKENQEAWKKWMELYLEHEVPNGQSQKNYHNLCKEFLSELKDETMLIVAHGGTIHAIMTHLLALPIESKWHFEIKLGSITLINYQHDFGVLSEMLTPNYDRIKN